MKRVQCSAAHYSAALCHSMACGFKNRLATQPDANGSFQRARLPFSGVTVSDSGVPPACRDVTADESTLWSGPVFENYSSGGRWCFYQPERRWKRQTQPQLCDRLWPTFSCSFYLLLSELTSGESGLMQKTKVKTVRSDRTRKHSVKGCIVVWWLVKLIHVVIKAPNLVDPLLNIC